MICLIDSDQKYDITAKYNITAKLLQLFVNFDLDLSEIFIWFGLILLFGLI